MCWPDDQKSCRIRLHGGRGVGSFAHIRIKDGSKSAVFHFKYVVQSGRVIFKMKLDLNERNKRILENDMK